MPSPRSLSDKAVTDVIADARSRAAMSDTQLAAGGLSRPFPSPEDWRDISIYFLMLDRFNNPSAAPASERLAPAIPWDSKFGSRQGGTFNGILKQLPYIRELGTNAIWITPVIRNTPAETLMSYHGYAAQDLLAIDERWASDGTRATAEAELLELVKQAHAMGIYVILDIVLNHFGRVFWYDRGGGNVTPSFTDQNLLNEAEGGGSLPDILWTNGFGDPRGDLRNSLSPAQGSNPDEAAYPLEFRNANLFRRRGSKTSDWLGTYPWLNFIPGDFGDMHQLAAEYEAADSDPLRKYGKNPTLSLLLQSYQYLVAKYDFD